MKRVFALALALASLGLVGGCGGSDPAATSTAPWTKPEAAQEYLRAVARGNRYVKAWEKKTLAPVNIREYAKGTVLRQDEFVRTLASGRWPAVVKVDINRVIRAWNSERSFYTDVYTANSQDEAWAAWLRVPRDQGSGAVADVRTKLGLPPPPD